MRKVAQTPQELRATLLHDVGKYIARIAKNIAEDGPVPPALIPMLVRDLYEHPRGGSASLRFAELAEALGSPPALQETRQQLARLDALEADVRAGRLDACLEACRIARSVERELRDYASPDYASPDYASPDE